MDEQSATDASHTNGQDKEQSKKISAYYSLVFPEFTFYIQTLSVTIGRRCSPATGSVPSTSSNTADASQVDIDLGALKSVSRLHAKIEYDSDEDRFVLVVIGRNGAWVDGVWLSSGNRAILHERSQIQIASRIFHFVLPPPPPDDPPSPSSQSSGNRPRSPSLDITSISPPSSLPSHSPPPRHVKRPSSPPRSSRVSPPVEKPANPKKRKKGDASANLPPKEKPKPEDMPPKPAFTYAQLIYRAIKALDGKATLQEIINWIMNEFPYYRYVDGTAWTSSVRHNLSSSRAFKKMERCGGDRGKGFFWSLDEEHLHHLEEQEAKNQADAKRRKDKGGALLSEPPLKRSIKGDTKGTPLPPPLTSTPLPPKTLNGGLPSIIPTNTAFTGATGIFAYNSLSLPPGYPLNPTNPYALLTQGPWATHNRTTSVALPPTPSTAATAAAPQPTPPASSQTTPASTPAIPNVIVPIILGPIPPSHSEYSPNSPNNSSREGYMILHEGKIIIDPNIFAGYTKEMLDDLAKLGANQALKSLTGHAVKALREKRIKARKDAKGKSKAKNGKASASTPKEGTNSDVVMSSADTKPIEDTESTIVVVDDSEEDGPVAKKRKTDSTAEGIAVS